ncbi:MAG TPA: ABC transporter permease [Kofleriaceae bacterium]|nr:ABC transporter permease [Kofleriaceae bacterium]
MRATSIIYKRELGRYLRSPIGWIIAAAALLVEGILFQSQALSGEQLSAIVLERYFYYASGIPTFCGVLLAFRLLAEERQNHSMVLLKTSPIRDTEIVLGKFFAALTFMAIIFVLSIYMPLLVKVNGKITFAQIFVGYFGMFLLGSATLAIGIFASALTRHQIVAALLGAVFVLIMCMLFPLAKRLDSPVREVLEQVDLWWIHFQNGFMRGILNLKDVIYYLAVTYFFLLLAVKTLEAKRWQ